MRIASLTRWRRTAVNAGVAIGLALAGMMFAMLTILVGLIALYRVGRD